MKYRVFETESEARAAQQDIYASFLRDRAAQNNGQLDDWSNSPIVPVFVDELPNHDLMGERFPLYGQRASDMVFITEYGHTTAWAAPFEIQSGQWAGQWAFESPDDEGIELDLNAE